MAPRDARRAGRPPARAHLDLPAWLPPRQPAGRPATAARLRTQREETFRRLVEAGREAFATRATPPPGSTTSSPIAGTSHGTFYLYFRNKEDLLHRLAVECGEDLDDLTAEIDELADDRSASPLEAWVGRFVTAYRRHSSVIRVWLERRELDPLMQALANDKLGSLAAGLTRRLDPSVADAVGPSVAALGLMSMLERMSAYLLSADGGMSEAAGRPLRRAMLSATFAGVTEPRPDLTTGDRDVTAHRHHRVRAGPPPRRRRRPRHPVRGPGMVLGRGRPQRHRARAGLLAAAPSSPDRSTSACCWRTRPSTCSSSWARRWPARRSSASTRPGGATSSPATSTTPTASSSSPIRPSCTTSRGIDLGLGDDRLLIADSPDVPRRGRSDTPTTGCPTRCRIPTTSSC